ncbi:MAG: hypothetical protein EOP88_06405 [Verrucomicrobiaceae bacterium]|nr:MAG: hypothetical protein EOP88_06405 [Verrucomicrobiaceae bacterium]
MNINESFDLVFYLNLATDQNARFSMEARLRELGVSAERFPTINGDSIRPRYVSNKETDIRWQYARYLTIRLALREARRRGARSVCFLEDDLIFHPNFKEIIKTIHLPEDWGIFCFGCDHQVAPDWIEGRIVRLRKAMFSHAFAVRGRDINRLLKFIRAASVRGADYGMDRILSETQDTIRAYGCFPNLASPPAYQPKKNGKYQGEYSNNGVQRFRVNELSDILERMATNRIDLVPGQTSLNAVKKVGFLFLTKGDLNHPEIWREYFSGYEDRVVVLSHPKYPKHVKSSVLTDTIIDQLIETRWGEVSLVRATRNLLSNALEIDDISHFILLSESCVPIQSLGTLLKRLSLDSRSRFRYGGYSRGTPIQKSRAQRIREIPERCWVFQPQWWLMDRKMALFAGLPDFTHLFEDVVASDEMYFGSVLTYQGIPLEGNVVNQPITWTWWEHDAGSPSAWTTLESSRHGRGILEDMVNSGAFFARKFPPGADIGKYGLHHES